MRVIEWSAGRATFITGRRGFTRSHRFYVSRVNNDRQRAKATYKAKSNNGTGDCVAQIEVSIGAMVYGSENYGLVVKLFCYQPTLNNGVRGKIEECLRLYYPAGAKPKDVAWEIRGEKKKGKATFNGSGTENSTRVKMGILDEALEHPTKGVNAAGKR